MKKVLNLFIPFIFCILLCGCDGGIPSVVTTLPPTDEVQETLAPIPSVSIDTEKPDNELELFADFQSIAKSANEDSYIYYNQTYGYELAFPEGWHGFYYIAEDDAGAACIVYFGSPFGTNNLSRDSYPMFYVATQQDRCYNDLAINIGNSGGDELYIIFPRTSPEEFRERDINQYRNLQNNASAVTDTFRGDVSEDSITECWLTNRSCIVSNEKYGYSIKFPDSWAGWFYTIERESGTIMLVFYGKSELASIQYKSPIESANGNMAGIPFSYLVAEDDLGGPWESQTFIGEAQKTNIYRTTATGVDIYMLDLNRFASKDLINYIIVTPEEEMLIAADWEQAQGMLADFKNGNFEFIS